MQLFHKYFLKILAKTTPLCYNNYSDKKRVIICVLKGILYVCFFVKSAQKQRQFSWEDCRCFFVFPLSCLLFCLLFVMLSAFLIYICRRNYRLKIRRREPTVFISPSLRLRLVSRQMKTLYHSFSSFFKENGSYLFTTQGKISNGQ